jgi:hypothetical protein
LYSTS